MDNKKIEENKGVTGDTKPAGNGATVDSGDRFAWGTVVGILVVVVVIILLMWKTGHRGESESMETPTTATTETSALVAPAVSHEDMTAGSVHAETPLSVLSYADALSQYADRRIQFDTQCQAAIPNDVTFKNNTDMMLDNRSPETRVIHLGFMGDITIMPWSFKIVNFSSPTVPMSVVMDCGTQQNVAQVRLQQ